MTIEPVRWQDWDAVRLLAGGCEMVVGVSAGPRILSLRRNDGVNLLHYDRIDFNVGDWRRYGGHRFTVAPEEARSYEPDNEACTVEARAGELRVDAAPSPDGTCRVLAIRAAADGAGFDLHHSVENCGDRPWQGALWAITCVPAGFPAVAPRASAALRYWPDSEGPGWRAEPAHVVLVPGLTRGKIGWHSEAGWLASLQPDATLVIHAPDVPAARECVDDGCNVEIYTSAECTELETLGGSVELAPGARVGHRQRWRLLAPGFVPADWAVIGAQAGCRTAERSIAILS